MQKDINYVPVFSYPLALHLANMGWVIHHTAPNKNDIRRKVYYFNYAPGIYDDMTKFKSIKEENAMNIETKVINGEPDYLIPIYDNKMVKYLLDMNYKIDHVEVYISDIDKSKRRVTFFSYQHGFYAAIQQYMNRRDKLNKKKNNKKKAAKEEN